MKFDENAGFFEVNIPSPCFQNSDNMLKVGLGSFCSECTKVVVDFRNYSDVELYFHFLLKKEKLCGTFYKEQMEREIPPPDINKYCVISGHVLDFQTKLPIENVELSIEGHKKTIFTDSFGFFLHVIPVDSINGIINISVLEKDSKSSKYLFTQEKIEIISGIFQIDLFKIEKSKLIEFLSCFSS